MPKVNRPNYKKEVMKKVLIITLLVLFINGCSAIESFSVYHPPKGADYKTIEDFVLRIEGGRNVDGKRAEELEKEFNIAKPNGIWNCIDRAEICKRWLKESGYKRVFYGHQATGKAYSFGREYSGHRYIILEITPTNVVELLKIK